MARGLLLLLLALATAGAQSRVTGVVTVGGGSSGSTPVADATVMARGGDPERAVAAADTDSQGRYTLEGLPEGRVTLSVQAQGYYTLTAGGLESETIARSCPATGDCPDTDFEMARTGVVEGWLTDAFGDPLQDVVLQARAPEEDAQPRGRRGGGARPIDSVSDDRGYFRIWGLPPGRYSLLAADPRTVYGRGPVIPLAEQEFEIAPDGGAAHVRLSVSGESKKYSVTGRITGVADTEGARYAVMAEGVGSGPGTRLQAVVRNGEFHIPTLSPGRYSFRLYNFDDSGREIRLLGEVEVDRNITDLTLTPLPPTSVRGRVLFEDSPPTAIPLRLLPADRSARERFARGEQLRVHESDYTFENAAVPTGRFDVETFGDYYLVEPMSVNVTPGQMTELEVRVSNQRSKVAGTAKLRDGEAREAASHFIVGIRGRGDARKMQADDNGRFEFDRLVPGEYEIAAWSRQDVDVDGAQAWTEAGQNVKKLTVEPGFEMEVDLTVAP